jgi:hypothetical protein
MYTDWGDYTPTSFPHNQQSKSLIRGGAVFRCKEGPLTAQHHGANNKQSWDSNSGLSIPPGPVLLLGGAPMQGLAQLKMLVCLSTHRP